MSQYLICGTPVENGTITIGPLTGRIQALVKGKYIYSMQSLCAKFLDHAH